MHLYIKDKKGKRGREQAGNSHREEYSACLIFGKKNIETDVEDKKQVNKKITGHK